MTAEFYKNAEIFMTGGSGVVGKAAIEKLLRSCDVKKIYILIRNKRGVSSKDRLEAMKGLRIFKVLKEQKPNELEKLVAIPGDITLDGLGISAEHRELMKHISIVFHSAATTRFNEPLTTSIRLNVKSTMEALKLAETFKQLKLFVHVSTFFSNPYLKHIEDKVYPAFFDWRTALKMLEPQFDKDPSIDAISHKVINSFPNTYTFTKHIAEKLVDDHREKLPVCIFRPSVVVGALEEPEPGFTESMSGVMGLILIWGTGLMQVVMCKKDVFLDVCPLDAGTKCMLRFASHTGRLPREKLRESTAVGKFSSYGLMTYNFDVLSKTISSCILEFPYVKSLWLPDIKLTSCPFIYKLYVFFLQLLPSMFIDVLLRIFRQRPIMMKIQRKILITSEVFRFFISNTYSSDGPTAFKEMLETEAGTEFDVTVVADCCRDYNSFYEAIKILPIGCRKFLLNEDDSSLPMCRKILKVKMFAYYLLKGYVLYVIGCAIYRRFLAYQIE